MTKDRDSEKPEPYEDRVPEFEDGTYAEFSESGGKTMDANGIKLKGTNESK